MTGLLCRVLQKNQSVPDMVGHREPARPLWTNVCINENETVPSLRLTGTVGQLHAPDPLEPGGSRDC